MSSTGKSDPRVIRAPLLRMPRNAYKVLTRSGPLNKLMFVRRQSQRANHDIEIYQTSFGEPHVADTEWMCQYNYIVMIIDILTHG